MGTGFHYEDVPPQNWLDELHSFNIQRVWDVQINNTQRTNLSKRAQDQLKDWRIALRDQIKRIEGRYDVANQAAKERVLAPYELLDKLGLDLNNELRELSERVKAGRAIPEGVAFGTRIFGDMNTKRWKLGERPDERRWIDFMAIERRYRTLAKEYKTQSQGYDNAKKRVDECKTDLQNLTAYYKQRKGLTQIGIRLIIVMSTVILCLLIGIVAVFTEVSVGARVANEVLAAVMFVLAVVGAIIAFILARRRRQSIAVVENDIAVMRETYNKVREEAKRQKNYLRPTHDTFKEVRADYQALKATF